MISGRKIALLIGAVWAGAGFSAMEGCGSSNVGSGGQGGGGTGSSSTSGSAAGGGVPAEGGAPDSGFGDPTGVQAQRASDFLGSIGVCTHMAQGVDAPDKSATALAYAGIRNLRDDGNPAAVPGWISVYKQAGVRTNMLPNGDIATTIDMAKQLKAAGALLSIELTIGQILDCMSRPSSTEATVTTLVSPRPRVILPKGPPEDLPV